MERLDCSKMVAEAKQEAGETNIYRADREQAILKNCPRESRKTGCRNIWRWCGNHGDQPDVPVWHAL